VGSDRGHDPSFDDDVTANATAVDERFADSQAHLGSFGWIPRGYRDRPLDPLP
jgi:hypothetical protein